MGPLPVVGGFMDQAWWFLWACRILDSQYSTDHDAIRQMRKKP